MKQHTEEQAMLKAQELPDTTRPTTLEDLTGEERKGARMVSADVASLGQWPQVMSAWAQLNEAAQEAGLELHTGYSGSELCTAMTAEDLNDALKEKQERWERSRKAYADWLLGSLEDHRLWLAREYARGEGLEVPGMP